MNEFLFQLNFRLFFNCSENNAEGDLSNILKKTSLRTVDLKTCQADYLRNNSATKSRINDSQYCAADPDRKSDACVGM